MGQTLKVIMKTKRNKSTVSNGDEKYKIMDIAQENFITKNCDVKVYKMNIIKNNKERERVKKQAEQCLWDIVEACTQQEHIRRIPDMRGIMTALTPLMSLKEWHGTNRNERKYLFFNKKAVCEKNRIIIQS